MYLSEKCKLENEACRAVHQTLFFREMSMYLSYYKLKIMPFQITSDPRFLWLGETHREAMATLKYGIYENKSFLMLTGDVGCGKTTLINSFVKKLNKKVLCAVLCDPGLSLLDLFNHIAFLFGVSHTFKSKGEFIIAFSRFLNNAHDGGKRVLLIIDEAQRIHADILEEICMLSNIERHDTKLINIFFVGQNEFRDMVARHANRSLRQKLTFSCQVTTLDKNDLASYIRHRLKIAGTSRLIFQDKAISLIYQYSGGNPRITNIICDLALLTGFVQEKDEIDEKNIQECVEELQLTPMVTKPLAEAISVPEEHIEVAPQKVENFVISPAKLAEPVSENQMENIHEEGLKHRTSTPEKDSGLNDNADTLNSEFYVEEPEPAILTNKEEAQKDKEKLQKDKASANASLPEKGKKVFFGQDLQTMVLLGLVLIIVVLSIYAFFQGRGGF